VGILIASTGMALMTLPGLRFEMDSGDILSVFCAVAFAFHIVLVGHYAPLVGFETLAVVQVAMAALAGALSVPFGFVLSQTASRGFAISDFKVAAAVLITGLLATALAFTTMAWAQQYTSATRAALIFALEPVVAWFTSWLLTGETLSTRQMFGAGLILAGIVIVELKRTDVTEHLRERASNV
jgi:drug/metabolite transporter (DMT)-like permease